MQNINSVAITGNLTRDPELRLTGGGTPICDMRVAVNGRRKNQAGAWIDDPNYFDVTVFGGQATACGNFLAKGRPIAVEGRLDWHEWEAKDGSGKRQQVKILGNSVQFLSYDKGEKRAEPVEEDEPEAAEGSELEFAEPASFEDADGPGLDF